MDVKDEYNFLLITQIHKRCKLFFFFFLRFSNEAVRFKDYIASTIDV